MEAPTELALFAFKYSHFDDFFEDFFTYFSQFGPNWEK